MATGFRNLTIYIYLKNAKYNKISHYQAINIELSPARAGRSHDPPSR